MGPSVFRFGGDICTGGEILWNKAPCYSYSFEKGNRKSEIATLRIRSCKVVGSARVPGAHASIEFTEFQRLTMCRQHVGQIFLNLT